MRARVASIRISLPYFDVEEEGSGAIVQDSTENKTRPHSCAMKPFSNHCARRLFWSELVLFIITKPSAQCGSMLKPLTRPKLVHIDEANSKAAEKLLGPNQERLAFRFLFCGSHAKAKMAKSCKLPERTKYRRTARAKRGAEPLKRSVLIYQCGLATRLDGWRRLGAPTLFRL